MPRTFNAPVLVGAGALLRLRVGEAALGCARLGRRAGVPCSGGGAGGGQRGCGAGAYNGQVYS